MKSGKTAGCICEADEALLFDSDLDAKYQSALARIGVSEASLSGGHFGNA